MNQIKRYKIPIIIVIVHLLIVIYFSTILSPDVLVPRQWNFEGEVGSYSGKAFGMWFIWGISAFLLLFFMFFPYIDPRYKLHKKRFDDILPSLMKLMTSFMMLIHIYQLMWAAEVQIIREYNSMMFIIGLLFIMLGNILPKIPSNFFAGFRSPWTLSSETIWKKTHRFGGYCFVISGVLMIIRGIIINVSTLGSLIIMFIALGICMVPYFYSYILYLKNKGISY